MFSFSALTIFTTLLLSVLTSALPSNTPDGDLRVPSDPDVDRGGIAARDGVVPVQYLAATAENLDAGLYAAIRLRPILKMWDDELHMVLASLCILSGQPEDDVCAPSAEVTAEGTPNDRLHGLLGRFDKALADRVDHFRISHTRNPLERDDLANMLVTAIRSLLTPEAVRFILDLHASPPASVPHTV